MIAWVHGFMDAWMHECMNAWCRLRFQYSRARRPRPYLDCIGIFIFAAGCRTLFTVVGFPGGSVQHFKPKRVLTRLHPDTNENLHQRFAQHRGSPRPGVSSPPQAFICPKDAIPSFHYSIIPSPQLIVSAANSVH